MVQPFNTPGAVSAVRLGYPDPIGCALASDADAVPPVEHIWFGKIEPGEGAFRTRACPRHLHQTYLAMNHSDGLVPFHRWFGLLHDRSKVPAIEMEARFAARKARLNKTVN